jgi:hypothetical protein
LALVVRPSTLVGHFEEEIIQFLPCAPLITEISFGGSVFFYCLACGGRIRLEEEKSLSVGSYPLSLGLIPLVTSEFLLGWPIFHMVEASFLE